MADINKKQRIRELTARLKDAAKAYYTDGIEIMPNIEYDALYDELAALENETGIIMAGSPTQRVGYETATELVKEAHESPMLSQDKTKDPEALAAFLGSQPGLLSWKMDGLTIVLTYDGGMLQKAVTRGNGEIGEVVTANAKTFVNVPLRIAYTGKLVIRGEAVIKYSDFARINEENAETEAKYKNPRNLCSGSVRQLNPEITAARSVNFMVFSLESATGGDEPDFKNSNEQKLLWLKGQGFDVVGFRRVTAADVVDAVFAFEKEIPGNDIPSDGLVLLMDDIEYGRSLGRTAKFPRNSIAFKWQDETANTHLLEIEWSPSRTGLINPVAIFEPVELEGTTVSRASLHNLSIIDGLELGIGDELIVYKANMIIPQVAENLTRSGKLVIPDTCPACGGPAVIRDDSGTKTLVCTNPDCPAKRIKSFAEFVSRNCMNIEGISEETLEKFISRGFIHEFADIYRLARFENEIVEMPGFGRKSYDNIIASVNASRNTTAVRVINALGILNVGPANAKLICRHFGNDFEKIRSATAEELLEIDQIGDVIASTFTAFFADSHNAEMVDALLAELTLEAPSEAGNAAGSLTGLTFVITGSLSHYANRDALKEEIEAAGGKCSGSVSAKTSYLINNDFASNSTKNKTAKSLGVPIITEEEYIERFRK